MSGKDKGGTLDGRCAVVLAGVGEATAALARALKPQGGRFVVMDPDLDRGHRLTLELNTGNGGIAVFLPGDPARAEDVAEAVEECRRCWPGEAVVVRRSD